MIRPYVILACVIAAIVAMTGSFAAGWKVSSWKQSTTQLKAANAAAAAQIAQQSAMVKQAQAILDKVQNFNLSNDTAMTQLQDQLEAQGHAISNLRIRLVTVKAGDCKLSPDADSLYSAIYDSTLGAADPAAAAGKAGAGHGPPAKAGATR